MKCQEMEKQTQHAGDKPGKTKEELGQETNHRDLSL